MHRHARSLLLALVLPLAPYVAACSGGGSDGPCANVTCSGHGTCSSDSGAALCTCEVGYLPSGSTGCVADPNPTAFDNPIIKSDSEDPTAAPADGVSYLHTADPAVLVHDGTVYLYAGHDESPAETVTWNRMYDWYVFSSSDLVHWTNHGAVMNATDTFSWQGAEGFAYAGQAVERDGKFYWYVPIRANDTYGGNMAIGVAVSDSPTGPFQDPRGNPLVADLDTPQARDEDIDPTVLVDDDGQAYMYWGQNNFYWVKLSEDMVHLEGEVATTYPESGLIAADDKSGVAIHQATVPGSFEAPWLHKHDGLYYLSYASGSPERILYATSASPEGPWEYQGPVLDPARWGHTIHQGIFDFDGASWIVYHDGNLPDGFTTGRSVCLDRLYYEEDGTIRQVVMTDTDPKGVRFSAVNYPLNWFTVQDDGSVRGVFSASASQRFDRSQWKLVQGLADAGGEYVSLESVALPGQYLYDAGAYGDADHRIRLGKVPADATEAAWFSRAATFKKVPGLIDGRRTSFQAYGDVTRFIRHYGYVLYVQTPGTFEDATFQLAE